jgi:hypothetical protein
MMVFELRVSEIPHFIGKKIEHLDGIEHNVYHQELCDTLEW